jgi:hypothetical protein
MSNPNLPPPANSTAASMALTGIAPRGIRAKSSQIITNVVAAGGTLPMRVSGMQYYVVTSTAPIRVRAMSAGSVGIFDEHTPGTGKVFDELNAFEQIEVNNPNAFAVIFQIFVGWDDYIDKRLILAAQTQKAIVYPTYQTPNSAAVVNITDLSGQQFQDIDNNKWYALNRIAIMIFNPDAGVTLLLQKSNSVVGNGPAIGVILPLTALRYDAAGNYRLHLGGANINAVVSEIYNAIASPT